jgi:hypothetical protein
VDQVTTGHPSPERTGDQLLDALLDLAAASYAEGRAVESGDADRAAGAHQITLWTLAAAQKLIAERQRADPGG